MSCKDTGKGEINCEDNGGAEERKLKTRNFDDRKCLACLDFFAEAEKPLFCKLLRRCCFGSPVVTVLDGAMMAL